MGRQHRYGTRKKKRDANERDIIKALEELGATVYPLDRPVDLLVGYKGVTHLLEVKNPDGRNQVNDEQQEFIDTWRGKRPIVVSSVAEALLVLTTANPCVS